MGTQIIKELAARRIKIKAEKLDIVDGLRVLATAIQNKLTPDQFEAIRSVRITVEAIKSVSKSKKLLALTEEYDAQKVEYSKLQIRENYLTAELEALNYWDRTPEELYRIKPYQKTIEVYGYRWFDKANGNTYCSAAILIDGERVATVTPTYGYDDFYLQAAGEELVKLGFLSDDAKPLRRYCRENDIKLDYQATDVNRENELLTSVL